MMGVPVDYQDQVYERKYKDAATALSTAVHSPQECVGERPKDKEQGQMIDVAKREPLIITVRGQMWSPGIYRALRRAGRTLEQAWRGSFV